MKKENKVIRFNYSKLEKKYGLDYILHKEYYGLFIKKGRLKIDTKRLLSILPNRFNEHCDFKRNTVYFVPFKKCKKDYAMNYFFEQIDNAKKVWFDQKDTYKKIIEKYMKKEFSKKAPNYDGLMHCGILEADEWQSANMMAEYIHSIETSNKISDKINSIKSTLYLETIHQIASKVEHAMMLTMEKNGYKGDRCGRLDIYKFMDGRIGDSELKIKKLPHYNDFDKFYSIWNFVKHNSKSTYDKIDRNWPELLRKKGEEIDFEFDFPSEHLAIEYLKLSDKFITNMLDQLLEFYYEFCELCYQEPKYFCLWNYDEYFINIVNEEIKSKWEDIYNPLGLPPWL